MSDDFVSQASVTVNFSDDGRALEARDLTIRAPASRSASSTGATAAAVDPTRAAGTISAIERELETLDAQINEGSFDPKTGAKVYARDEEARAKLSRRAALLRNFTLPQARNVAARAEQQAAQRAAEEKAARAQQVRDQLAIRAAAAESPELGRMVAEELKRERARQIARALVNGGQ